MAVVATTPRFPDMQYRRLGATGLFVSTISLGGWVTFGGHVAEEKTFDCMKAAYDAGINFFDTAEAYSAGESEVVMGKAIRKFGWKRNDLVIATKTYFGVAYGENKVNNVGLSRKHIIESTKASLARLGLDYVDILYAHRPDRITPMEETVRAFNHVIDRGWAFYWGTSMWTAAEIAEASEIAARLGLVGPTVEQPVYNLLERDHVDREFARAVPRFGLGLTIWSPLKQGILTGKYVGKASPPDDSRFAVAKDPFTSSQRAAYGNAQWQREMEQVAAIGKVAERLGVPLAQLALAWCLKNELITSVITGASRPEQLVENVAALKVLPKLTPEVMDEIDQLLANKPDIGSERFGF